MVFVVVGGGVRGGHRGGSIHSRAAKENVPVLLLITPGGISVVEGAVRRCADGVEGPSLTRVHGTS